MPRPCTSMACRTDLEALSKRVSKYLRHDLDKKGVAPFSAVVELTSREGLGGASAVRRVVESSCKDGMPRFWIALIDNVEHVVDTRIHGCAQPTHESDRISRRLVRFLRYESPGGRSKQDLVDLISKENHWPRTRAMRYVETVLTRAQHRDGRHRFAVVQDDSTCLVFATESSTKFDMFCLTDAKATHVKDIKDTLFRAIQELNSEVATRASHEITEDDQRIVQNIRESVAAWMQVPGWEAMVPADMIVDDQPGVMRRLHVYEGTGIRVRLHMFEDPGETFIHNHRSSFWSCCMAGRYRHCVWAAVDKDDPSAVHYCYNRTQDPGCEESREVSGRLIVAFGHDHVPGESYFIHAGTPHTVKPFTRAALPEPVLTLYIKGSQPIVDTVVLAESADPSWTKPNATERELQVGERLDVLRRMRTLMMQASIKPGEPEGSVSPLYSMAAETAGGAIVRSGYATARNARRRRAAGTTKPPSATPVAVVCGVGRCP